MYDLNPFEELFDNFCEPLGSVQAMQNSLEDPSQKIKPWNFILLIQGMSPSAISPIQSTPRC
jgi:hypothetical protein